MNQLSHESLTVYQRSIEFVAWATKLTNNNEIKGVILDQFKRAFISIPLNIAEGAGKYSAQDQARGKELLKEIVAMLPSLSRKIVKDRVYEEDEMYQF